MHDSFFDLGGHSLLVMQLMGEIEQAFEITVTVKDLFENMTVATQAALVDGAVSMRHALASVTQADASSGERAELLL